MSLSEEHPSLLQMTPETTSGTRTRRFLIDSRSAGCFRISLGLLLLLHAWTHLRWYRDLYSSAGVLPARLLPGSQEIPYFPSLITWLESTSWGGPAFVVFAIVAYLCLVLGWQTRVATCLSLLAFSSIAHRNPYLVMGADEVLGSMLLWSCLLPLGSRFSWDCRRASSGLPQRHRNSPASIASFGILLQLGVVYFVTAWLKSGPTWWADGTALERVLGLTEFRRPAADWLQVLPAWSLTWLTRAALVLEYALPALILSPWQQTITRRLAIVGIVGLHGGIALVLDAGLFSATMIAMTPLLLSPADWRGIERIVPKLRPPDDVLPLHGPISRGRSDFQRVASSVLAIFLLLGLVQENVARLLVVADNARLIPVLALPWQFAAAAQRWTMFAPDPPEFELQFTVQIRTADGSVSPLWDSARRDDPRQGFLWSLYLRRAALPLAARRESESVALRQQLCRFFAGLYARGRSSTEIASDFIEIDVTHIPTIRNGPHGSHSRTRLASYRLVDILER